MITMNRSDLLTYLKQAIDLETAVLTQKHIISEYDSSAEKRKPVLSLIDVGDEPNESDYTKDDPFGSIAAGICLITFGIVCVIFSFFLVNPDLWVDNSGGAGMLMMLLVLVGGGMLIGGGYSVFLKKGLDISRKRKSYTNACVAYNNAKEQATRDNTAIAQQYATDKQTWEKSNIEAHTYLSKPLKETETILHTLYAKDVIYPKYRTLPALTSIYEYLITGRCEELTGPHGAYNLYEDEVRKDTVISQLNTVIENLEQIRQNQYMLYEQVKGIQRATQAIAIELNQIKGYTALLTEISTLNLYYNGINAMNSTALAYCRSL